jgi:hypothetical protein
MRIVIILWFLLVLFLIFLIAGDMMTKRDIVNLEVKYAKIEARNVINERGQLITIYIKKESDIVRDEYGSIIKSGTASFDMYAFPVVYNPSRREIEKAGLFEESTLLIYTAKLDWEDRSIDFKDINAIISYIEISGEKFLIKEKGRAGNHANDYLYITFNLSKE